MVRQEKDREDLMAEAHNFVHRCELRLPGQKGLIFGGFRRDGRLSLYFDQDPVYHFDSQGRIRRAFVAQRLYKAELGRLVQLTRVRSPQAVSLIRHDMSDQETAVWLQQAAQRFDILQQALDSQTHEVIRVYPGDVNVPEQIHRVLKRVAGHELRLAPSPRSL